MMLRKLFQSVTTNAANEVVERSNIKLSITKVSEMKTVFQPFICTQPFTAANIYFAIWWLTNKC